jgi:hypothetical protein
MRHVIPFMVGPISKRWRCQQAALLAALCICVASAARGQVAAGPQAQASGSLAKSLKHADTGQTQLHIFYVRGMGIVTSKRNAGTQNFEVSEPFRKSFCKLIDCVTNEFEGSSYANEGDFAPDAEKAPSILAMRRRTVNE